MENESIKSFSLEEVASWGMAEHWDGKEYAALPPIQRGFVWKPEQVERLWDSIAQGFPIGSLLLEELKDGKSSAWRSYAGTSKRDKPPKWHLLDGQQRATSIIKGFHDVWSQSESGNNAVSALWVDLSPKRMEKTDRRFLFRLVTKSHPWGYKKSDPSKPLSASACADALKAYRDLNDEGDKRPHEFNLDQVFPWDSHAPVPVALLLELLRDEKNEGAHGIADGLRDRLKEIDIWKRVEGKKGLSHFENVNEVLNNPTKSFEDLVYGLSSALESLCMPAPVLNVRSEGEGYSGGCNEDEYNPTYNLFKRVNSGGTTLSNEEIQYSLLKSVWAEAPKVIEDKKEGVLGDLKLCQPARMVNLLARLFLMVRKKTPDGSIRTASGLQNQLSIGEFQRLLHHSKDDFTAFCKNEAKTLVKRCWDFLVYSEEDSEYRPFGLPTVLAASIARSHQDILLLIMYWMHMMGEATSSLSEEDSRRSLGFVTAMAWFAEDASRCIRRLAQEIDSLNGAQLFDFFNHERFSLILEKDEKDRVLMVRPRTPDEVDGAFRVKVTKEVLQEEQKDSDVWKTQDFWNLYTAGEAVEGRSWYPADEFDRRFLFKVYNDPKWNKLLYAQRQYIKEWYNWFDPTHPEMVTDRNRPWDYDHILPQSWSHDGRGVLSDIPPLVRTWIWSIGNFRAWPMEHNRSKGNKEILEEAMPDYGLKDEENVRKASFIRKQDEWNDLASEIDSENPDFWNKKDAWPVFIEAALLRTVDIYREWFDELKVAELIRGGQ